MRQTPTIALAVAAGASALYWIIRRRQMVTALHEPLPVPPAPDPAEQPSKEVEP
jgi:hypothetical protein